MKKTIIGNILILALGALTAQIVTAQGTVTYLSNVAQTSAGGTAVGSDSWLAASFGTGNNSGGYLLDSVQFGMADASGSPNGFIAMLYSANTQAGFSPGAKVGSLNGSGAPAIAGDYTYTPDSGLTLSPNTVYFIVITAGTTVADGAYEWSYAGTYSYNTSAGWQAPIVFGAVDNYQSSDGSHWSLLGGPPQFAIKATPAPEPGVLGLFALGGLLVAFQRRKARTGK
jgi:hypothetical protein